MTLEEKELVIKDLCCRLPYNVKIKRSWIAPMTGSPEETITTFSSFDVEVLSSSIELNGADGFVTCEDGKTHTVRNYSCLPYLRPLSSMTEDEYNELKEISSYYGLAPLEDIHNWTPNYNLIDWLNAHHFDYRGLIPMGLALEAKEGMYIKTYKN